MKNKLLILPFLAAMVLVGCSTVAPYETKDVSINIELLDVSAGYARVRLTPSDNAYYYMGMIELDSGQTFPYQDANHFMVMQLDQANIEYLKWRHDLLENNTPYIASFVDHILSYGKVEHTVVHLTPGQNYFVFAFVVDPTTIKPVGDLFYRTFVTTDSSYKKIYFDYRIDDWWDFVYPVDTLQEINSTHPYMVSTVSQEFLLNFFENDTTGTWDMNKPFWYFYYTMLYYNYTSDRLDESKIQYGVYSACHEYQGLAPDSLVFEPGKTYYTGIFSADGLSNMKQYQIYKFTWQPGMKKEFSHLSDDIDKSW